MEASSSTLSFIAGTPKNGIDNPLNKTLYSKGENKNSMPFLGEAAITGTAPVFSTQVRLESNREELRF